MVFAVEAPLRLPSLELGAAAMVLGPQTGCTYGTVATPARYGNTALYTILVFAY